MGILSKILIMFLFAIVIFFVGLAKKNRLLKTFAIVLFIVSAVMLFFVWIALGSM